jgi:chromosome segregation ATPase
MIQRHGLALLVVSLCAALAAPAMADDNDQMAKLRDAARNAILQVRQLEDERAALQAKQAESDQTITSLKQQVDALTKQLAGPATVKKDEFDRMQTEFEAKLTAQTDQIGKLNEVLQQWKAALEQARGVVGKQATDLKAATGERDELKDRDTKCEAKNARLFTVGNQILDRLKTFTVQDAVKKFEPFVGTKRVELENLAQDFQDKLLDQKVSDQKVTP